MSFNRSRATSPLEQLYGLGHKFAKLALRGPFEPPIVFDYVYSGDDGRALLERVQNHLRHGNPATNGDAVIPTETAELFYGENGFDLAVLPWQRSTRGIRDDHAYASADEAWRGLIDRSVVPPGWRNSGFHTVCYLKKSNQWALSNWIWTSAAIARYYGSVNDIDGVVRIADTFLSHQLENGAWIVRFDYLAGLTAPIEAPNDSAYIASNSLLQAFEMTANPKYLDAAKRCARWIMEASDADGMVPFGYNRRSSEWVTHVNIVDVGFTAELFVRLHNLTDDSRYLDFARRFIFAYIARFRNANDGSFATTINDRGERFGGRFARGQAWALEGIVPVALATEDSYLLSVAEGLIKVLVGSQRRDGSWTYNLARPLSGADCKGVPVIARSLAAWGAKRGDAEPIQAAARAVEWSRAHTVLEGPSAGGIFSYSMEGAVTHTFYSEAAFVYGSSYALETVGILASLGAEGTNVET